MPPGAYVPPETKAPIAVKGQTIEPQNQPENQPMTVTPVIIDNPEPVAPAPAPELKQEKKTPAPAPAPKVEKPVRKTGTTHVIQKGDSFWSIALLYGVSMDEVIALNPGMDPLKLHVGDKVNIPASGSRKVMKRTAGKAPARTARTARKGKKTVAKPVKDDGLYEVRKGDSFSRIAARFHVRAADLAAANNMTLDQTLQIGQKLNLPVGGRKAAPQAPAEKRAFGNVPASTPAPIDEELLLKDIQNPDTATAPLNATAPGSVPAPEGQETAPAAPAGDKPLASEEAVKAVSGTAVPAAGTDLPASLTDTAVPPADTTIDALAAQYGIKADDIKTLNPALPADGKIKAGTVVQLP